MSDHPRTVNPATDPEPPEGTVIAWGRSTLLRCGSRWGEVALQWHILKRIDWDVVRWGWDAPGAPEDAAQGDDSTGPAPMDPPALKGPQNDTQRFAKLDDLDMWVNDADARLDKLWHRMDEISDRVSELAKGGSGDERTLGTGVVIFRPEWTTTTLELRLDWEALPVSPGQWEGRRVRIIDEGDAFTRIDAGDHND